jgi:hypothetical protein
MVADKLSYAWDQQWGSQTGHLWLTNAVPPNNLGVARRARDPHGSCEGTLGSRGSEGDQEDAAVQGIHVDAMQVSGQLCKHGYLADRAP